MLEPVVLELKLAQALVLELVLALALVLEQALELELEQALALDAPTRSSYLPLGRVSPAARR